MPPAPTTAPGRFHPSQRQYQARQPVNDVAAAGTSSNPLPRESLRVRSRRPGVGLGHNARPVGVTVEVVAEPSGAVYTVAVAESATCDCEDATAAAAGTTGRRRSCPHVRFVLGRVLFGPGEGHLSTTVATPPRPREPEADLRRAMAAALGRPPGGNDDDAYGGKAHRQAVEGDCPICLCSLDAERKEVAWCRATCGVNIHTQCFLEWAVMAWSEGQNPFDVKCPHCRAEWIFPGRPRLPQYPFCDTVARFIDRYNIDVDRALFEVIRLWYWIEETRKGLNDMVFLNWGY